VGGNVTGKDCGRTLFLFGKDFFMLLNLKKLKCCAKMATAKLCKNHNPNPKKLE
jgi:hypothetical protein